MMASDDFHAAIREVAVDRWNLGSDYFGTLLNGNAKAVAVDPCTDHQLKEDSECLTR